MTGTRIVRAVLVTDGRSSHLPAALAALADIQPSPSTLHLVVVGDAEQPHLPPSLDPVISRTGARTYAEAVDAVLAEHPAHGEELLWLLHDDLAPAPDALARLEATARKRPRAAVVGGAHVRWDDAFRLVNVGTTVSRWGARRIGLAAEDDINQGQYDSRDDVLAVSLAGALVARSAWESLGGLDAGYRGFGDSIEFCRRAWASGADVVVVPAAKFRHAQDALYDRRGGAGSKRATHARRRIGEWYHAFAWAPLWALLPLALLVLPSAVARALTRIMQNHPRLVLAELMVPLALLGSLPDLVATRRSIARIRVGRGAERRLLAGPLQVLRHVRERELGGWEQVRAARGPTDVVRGELAARRRLHRAWFATVAVVALAVTGGLTARWWLGLVDGLMLTGQGVGATDVARTDLWARTWSGLSEAGLGIPTLDGAWSAMMMPLTLSGDTRVGLGLLVALAPLLAVVSGWIAIGALTRAPFIRAAAALAYGLWPLFLAAVLDVRVGAVIAHLALPWVAWGVLRAAGWVKGEVLGDGSEHDTTRRRPSASAGMVAALAMAAATTAAPALLLPLVLVIAAVGAVAGALRWRVWSVMALSLVVSSRALWVALSRPGEAVAVLWRENGPSAPFASLTPWQLLTGTDGAHRWADVLTTGTAGELIAGVLPHLPGALALLLTVVALATARTSPATVVGALLAALGVAVAAVSQGTVAAWPDAAGHDAVRGWPGPGSSLVALGAVIGMAAAYGALPALKSGRHRAGAGFARAGAVVLIVAVLAPAVFTVWPGSPRGLGQVASASVLPLAVPLELTGQDRQRALVLDQAPGDVIAFSVLATDGTELVTGRVGTARDGTPWARQGAYQGVDRLVSAVATLAATGEGGTEELAAWGIGVVVVAPGQDRLRAALDANPALALIGGGDHGTSYRVARPLSDTPVSRAWLVTTEGELVVPSGPVSGALDLAPGVGGVLLIATPADHAWRAALDGQELPVTVDDHGRQAFAVPSTGGVLTYEFRDPGYRWWWWAAAVATAWALLGAVPLGARGVREGQA